MKQTIRYSTEPSGASLIIGVVVTLLGLGLALNSTDALDVMRLTAVGALISAVGALALGVGQNAKVSAAHQPIHDR